MGRILHADGGFPTAEMAAAWDVGRQKSIQIDLADPAVAPYRHAAFAGYPDPTMTAQRPLGEDERLVRTLTRTGISIALICLIWLPFTDWLEIDPIRRNAVALFVILGPLVAWLARSGFPRAGALALLGGVWASLTTIVFIGGGIDSPAFAGFLILIFSAGLLIDTRATLVVSALSLVTAAAINGLFFSGVVERADVTHTPAARLVAWTALLVAATAIAAISTSQVARAIRLARERGDELQRMHERFEASHEQYRRLIENSSDMVLELDMTGTIAYASPVVTEHLGFAPERLVGNNPIDFSHPDDLKRVAAAIDAMLETGGATTVTSRVRHSDGSWIWFETTGRVIESPYGEKRLAFSSRNIMERRKLEEELRQAQRVESLGLMAGGIAHDFNNLLAGIVGNAELARQCTPSDSREHKMIAEIEQAGWIAADLTRQLLTYAGKAPVDPKEVELRELVKEIPPLLEAKLPESVVIELEISRPPCWTVGDRAQISQIVMNLITNAAESLPVEGGHIRVTAGTHHLSSDELDELFVPDNPRAGEYAYIEVADNGSGISKRDQERIFDPFFTTKFQGRGLGLATVLGTVRKHRGVLRVESEPEGGTTVRVSLPSVEPPVALAEKTREKRPALPSGSVLVIDDDAIVRQLLKRQLTVLGLTAVDAASGREGLDVLCADPSAFDFVVLDLTMPGMDGEQTFAAIREFAPQLPVLLISGHSEQVLLETFSMRKHASTLKKPFTMAALEQAISKLLKPQRV
jgi:PAS domain S-box-containing protein